jgi:hypothetical protein
MGSSYSYLKIRLPNGSRTIGFIFYHNNLYKKYVITAGNGANSSNTLEYIDRSYYEIYGDYYYYDGNAIKLDKILSNYDPKYMDTKELVNKLTVECNLEKYESTWEIICKWSKNVISYASYVPSKLLITGIKYLFCPSTVQRLENF